MKPVNILTWLFILIPILWLVGLHVTDPVRIILAVFAVGMFFPAFRKTMFEYHTLSKLQSRLLLSFIILYPVLICTQHLVRVYAGSHGINFAYRTQVIESFLNSGELTSTILQSDYSSQNWLDHHFNPILVIPGLLGLPGINAYMTQIVCLFFIIISVSVIIYKILLIRNYSKNIIYIPIVFFFSLYAVRHPFTYGIEDEFFALPLIALAFYFLFKNNFPMSCLFIFLTFSVKESFFLLGISWGVMGFVLFRNRIFGLIKSDLFFSTGLILLGMFFFGMYTFGHEILFGKTYEHFHKAGGIGSLFDIKILFDKFFNFVLLFLPFLFFPFLNRKCLVLLIPAVPFLMLMFYSNYMFKATDYYAVIPSFIIFISCIYYLPEKSDKVLNSVRPGIFVLIFALAYLHGTWKPTKILADADSSMFVYYDDLESVRQKYISDNDKVLVSLSLAPLSTMMKKLAVIEDESRISTREFDFAILKVTDVHNMISEIENHLIPLDTMGRNRNILIYGKIKN